MTRVIVLTGPPGSGTETVAELLARRVPRAAVIDVADLRAIVTVGRREPWEGDAGVRQQELAVRNACALAANFVAAEFQPIVLDVVTDATSRLYRELLQPLAARIVVLLPSFDAVDQRNASRTPPFTSTQLRSLYESQRRLSEFDALLDTTNLNASEVADRVYNDLFD